MSGLELVNGSRVGVIGGGPAGSFFSYHLLDMAHRMGKDLHLDIFEPRVFDAPGPAGCNMCGGIISESLVQNLAADGIRLPAHIVQRGLESYTLHLDVGQVRIDTPRPEKGIAAVYRGAGPRGLERTTSSSFDGFLLDLAIQKGAQLVRERVQDMALESGRPRVWGGKTWREYDLVAVAVGVNSAALRRLPQLGIGYEPPRTTRAFISEFYLGQDVIGQYLGSSMHVFLLNIPRLEFAAIIPKGDYVTVCLLGEGIDDRMIRSFLQSPQVRACFPPELALEQTACHCSPHINVLGVTRPYADRVLFIGDCAVTRLYKDGIGAAYRTSKSAARAALQGIAASDFEKQYWPACQAISADNEAGKVLFAISRRMQKMPFAQRAVLRMALREQSKPSRRRRVSMVLWDMFTGSAQYREISLRMLHPVFLIRLAWNSLLALLGWRPGAAAVLPALNSIPPPASPPPGQGPVAVCGDQEQEL
jgi:flavin-dependent dehydrogenase